MPSTRTAMIWPALTAVTVLFLIVVMVLQYQAAPTSVALGAGGDPAAASAAAAPAAVAVELSEFAISPDPVVVPAGAPVTIDVANVGALPHDLHVVGGPGTPEITGGSSAALALDPMAAGTYELLCQLPGHAAAGMTATLEVTEDAVATTVATDGAGAHTGHGDLTPQEMVELHDEGIASFLDGDGGEVLGNNELEHTVDADGAKVFELTASEIEWETKPGVVRSAMAYNGQVPGPKIRAELGDRIKIVLNNEMSVPTAIHLHGLLLPNGMDGVPGITQDAVMSGESYTYDITLDNAGSHMYHSHFDAATQVPAGLLGAIIVEDVEGNPVTEDHDYTMILNDGPLGFTINGKDFPATEPLVMGKGETMRIRFMNEGLQIHPMHLHGMHMTVIEKDGYPLPQPYKLDTVNIAPGERIDVVVEAKAPGAWAFHCHILNHAEGPDGMFGMVTALVITE